MTLRFDSKNERKSNENVIKQIGTKRHKNYRFLEAFLTWKKKIQKCTNDDRALHISFTVSTGNRHSFDWC